MKGILISVVWLCVCLHGLKAQNLVPNASFETYLNCPTGNSQLDGNVIPWVNPPGSGTTPDYFNACAGPNSGCNDIDVPSNFAGYSPAYDGNGYAGFFTYYTSCPNCREYIQVPLSSALTSGQSYILSMRIRLGGLSQYATNNMGMYLSNGPVSQPSNQPITGVTPQANPGSPVSDTANWTLVSALYTSIGGEDYLTIGNFYDNTNTQIVNLGPTLAGCALAGSAAFYYIDSVQVALTGTSSVPSVSFLSSDTSFCDKKCIDFTDLSTNSPNSWQWSFPGAVPSTSSLQNPTNICYNAYGSFDVTLIACNAAGCDTLYIPSFITEYQLPPQPVITQSNDTLYCTPASSYAWYDASNPGVVVSTNPYFETSAGGSYFVIVGDSVGCQNSSSVFTALNIMDPEAHLNGFYFYPNPAKDQMEVYIPSGGNHSTSKLKIAEVSGKVIYEESVGGPQVKINLENFSSGLYFIYLITDHGMECHKLLIHK